MSLSGPGPTCSFFWGWVFQLSLQRSLIAQFAMASVTNNKALLMMIPQFLAQAAMLIPIALLFRWKYERPFLGSLRLGVTCAGDLAIVWSRHLCRQCRCC